MTGKRDNKLLQALEKDSAVLEDQRGSFASISNKMRIICAYEEIPMSVGGIVRSICISLSTDPHSFPQVVPEESAVFEGFNVKKISVPADHSNMCKFSDSQDAGYRRILDQIITCLKILDASISPDQTQRPPQESVVILSPHDETPRPSSKAMTVSLGASRSPDTQEYVFDR
jgi:hypothetical protein